MGYDLGVDLGTTFVAAAISRGERVEMCTLGNQMVATPAVVYSSDSSHLLFGEAAERQGTSHPDRVEREFKRRLGDPTPVVLGGVPYQVTTLMGALLRDVLTKVTATEGGPPTQVALTHPANWGPYRRELFEEIPQLAGLSTHQTLSEPEAAAAYYATTRYLGVGDTIAVYDLGGGTFDATVLRKGPDGIEMLGDPEGIERLGGIDFDEAILQWINYTHGGVLAELDMSDPQSAAAMAKLRQECVQAKEALSVDTETSIPVLLPYKHFTVRLTRPEFEGMIRAPIESTIGTLARTLRSAQVDVDELSAVLLVGGSSRIPLIARMISEELGRPTLVDTHPKHAVALGAATMAGRAESPVVRQPRISPVAPINSVAASGGQGGPPDEPRLPAVPGPGDLPAEPATTHPAPVAGVPGVPPARRRSRAWLPGGLAAAAVVVLAVVGFKLLPGGSTGTVAPPASVSPTPSVAATSSKPAVAVPIPSIDTTIKLDNAPDFVVAHPREKQLYIANATAGKVSVFDTSANKVVATIPVKAGPPQFLAFSPGGRFVYISIWDKPFGKIHAVSVLDTTDNSIKATIQVSTRPFLAAVTPDGKFLYVPNHDSGTVSVIDTGSLKLVHDIKVAPNPHYVAFSVDGKRAYTANHESNLLSVIDTGSRKVIHTIGVGKSPHSLAVNPKRPMLVNVNYDGNSVSVTDTGSNKVTKTIKVENNPQNINWSPDGRFAYAVNNTSNSVSVISADDLDVTAILPTKRGPTSIAVLPDGTKGYVSNLGDSSLTVINLAG